MNVATMKVAAIVVIAVSACFSGVWTEQEEMSAGIAPNGKFDYFP